MTKNIIRSIALLFALMAGISSLGQAESERELFDKGMENALKVLKYEKEHSLKKENLQGKYCVALFQSGKEALVPFDVVKLESLALFLKYEPAYLQHSENGASKNTFCFAYGDTQKEADFALKAIRSSYPKVDSYYPEIIQLSSTHEYKRVIPYLGIWTRDMSETVALLNSNILTQKEELEKQKAENDAMRKKLKDVAETISKITGHKASDISKQETEEDTPKEVEKFKVSKKDTPKEAEKNVTKKSMLPEGIKQHPSSERVFTIAPKKS